MIWTERRFVAFDKTPLFYRFSSPQKPLRAAILCVHGMGEHGGRYIRFGEFLAEKGIALWLPDLRGFGLSGGSCGCVRRFSDYHRDLEALEGLIERTFPRIPLFFMGHSFGGLIAASYVALKNAQAAGLILSSPLFKIAVPVPRWRHAFALIISKIFPNYTESNRVNAVFLTHDQRLVQLYSRDPLVHYQISARLYRELIGMMARQNTLAEKIKTPTLILQAGEDRIVSKNQTELFYQKLTAPDKTLEVYENFYHEVLNEVGHERVFSRISGWLDAHLS